jgi:hypothetical protein
MSGCVFAKSKGLGRGSSFYLCIPQLLVDSDIYLRDLTIQSHVQTKEVYEPKTEQNPPPAVVENRKSSSKKILLAEVSFSF